MTKSVMIVDDHPAIRVAIHALLSQSKEFSTISESVDGSEALEKLKNNPVDLVIIDIELPNFDGFSLLKNCSNVVLPANHCSCQPRMSKFLQCGHYKLALMDLSVRIKILVKYFLRRKTYYVVTLSSHQKR